MTRYTPPSIKSQGLETFLNDSADKHRGLGYREFKVLYEEAGLNLTNLARAFNVSRPTMLKYIETYDTEKSPKREKALQI